MLTLALVALGLEFAMPAERPVRTPTGDLFSGRHVVGALVALTFTWWLLIWTWWSLGRAVMGLA